MSKIVSLILFLFTLNLSLSSQVKLEIVIQNLENNKGSIALELLDDKEQHIKGYFGEINDTECIIVLDSLKPDQYAFRYFHDENDNQELDKNWLGIPKEAYGFSNNAAGNFGPPKFEKTLFEIKKDTIMYCIPSHSIF